MFAKKSMICPLEKAAEPVRVKRTHHAISRQVFLLELNFCLFSYLYIYFTCLCIYLFLNFSLEGNCN